MLTGLGHEVRLISPQFVTPYVKSNKNDRNDAEAICELLAGLRCALCHRNQPISWRCKRFIAFVAGLLQTGSSLLIRF